MSRARRLWPVFFLAICALLPLWRSVFLGETIGPFDQIRHMAPWNGPAPDRPWDVLQADAVLQFYPWRDMVFDAWRQGQIPAWNPYELGGAPLLANSQSAALYPPHILMGVLHVPTGAAITFLAWFHLFWAGLGVFYLTRRLRGSRTGAALAGVAFALSPFMLAWTPLASVITTVSWIPWILGLVVVLFRSEPEALQSPGKRNWGRLLSIQAFLALSIAMMLLAGHLQFCAYGIGAALLLTLWLLVSERTRSIGSTEARPDEKALASYRYRGIPSAGLVAVALLAGFLLASPQLLPVLNYSHFSHRANTPSAVGYSAYVKGAIPVSALQGVAFPTAVGNPAKPSPQIKDVNDYWPQLTNIGMDFAETALGLGPLVFLLLFFGKRLKGGTAAMAAVGVLGLLATLGTFVDWPLYYWVPGWSATGSPGRAGVLFVLAGCVLAGVALSQIGTRKPKQFATSLAAIALIGLVLGLAPIVFGIAYSSPLASSDQVSSAIRASVSGEFPVFGATIVIALGVLAAARYKPVYAWTAPVGAVLVAFAAYGWNLIPSSSQTLPPVQADPTLRYAFVNGNWGLWSATRALMPPNTASYSRIHDLGGYDSLLHRDSVNMLRAVDGGDPAPGVNGNMMLVKPKADPKLLAEAGVSRVWSLRPLDGFGQASENAGVLEYQIPGPGRVSGPGPAQIKRETYDELKVVASGPGLLVDRDRMMPGWSATIDGKAVEITPADSPLGKGLWRQVSLPAGPHEIDFLYSPPGLSTGLFGAAIGTGWCCLCWALFFRGRKPSIESES